jgi:hypothetical protein
LPKLLLPDPSLLAQFLREHPKIVRQYAPRHLQGAVFKTFRTHWSSEEFILKDGHSRFSLGSAALRLGKLLKFSFEPLEHLFFDVFDVSELAPPSHITVFSRALNLYDKLSTNPSLSGYFSRRCCLQMSAVCFCRFLVPRPIVD